MKKHDLAQLAYVNKQSIRAQDWNRLVPSLLAKFPQLQWGDGTKVSTSNPPWSVLTSVKQNHRVLLFVDTKEVPSSLKATSLDAQLESATYHVNGLATFLGLVLQDPNWLKIDSLLQRSCPQSMEF